MQPTTIILKKETKFVVRSNEFQRYLKRTSRLILFVSHLHERFQRCFELFRDTREMSGRKGRKTMLFKCVCGSIFLVI